MKSSLGGRRGLDTKKAVGSDPIARTHRMKNQGWRIFISFGVPMVPVMVPISDPFSSIPR